MPMKRSGRSVLAASRVMEIDEGIGRQQRGGLEVRRERPEDPALDVLLLGRRLDGNVDIGEGGEIARGVDTAHRGVPRGLIDRPLGDLPVEVVADAGQRLAERVFLGVAQHHLHPRHRADLRNAAAHLPGPDDSDALDCHRSPPFQTRRASLRGVTGLAHLCGTVIHGIVTVTWSGSEIGDGHQWGHETAT